jgi:hypothetical protein
MERVRLRLRERENQKASVHDRECSLDGESEERSVLVGSQC